MSVGIHSAIQTSARQGNEGTDLIINGQKMWITNGHQADWICLLARTNSSDNPYANKSLLCVNMAEPGKFKHIFKFKVQFYANINLE